MKNKNHNIRFNMEKGDECRAWELLHSPQIRQMFKSQNKFVIEAVNDYYERHMAVKNDPYMETREKEDAFAERIVGTVEKKVMSNLPALFGMDLCQYFGHKKLKVYVDFFNSSSSFCCGVL